MADQQKYTNKLQGKNILVIGGSSGTLSPISDSMANHTNIPSQASVIPSPKPPLNTAPP